jgi:hypothetical protein
MKFLNLQNILTLLSCIGVFFLATKIESCKNSKELHRMDKKVAKYEEGRLNDSTIIASQKLQIFDLQQSIDASKGNDSKLQLVIAEQAKTIKLLKDNDNSCCAELKHLEKTENIRYFVKAPLSKWYTEVFEKPKFIK